ncbi:glycosyltransferase family 2 protein [Halococcus dombrowskii]|uniref:Glycosyltransferase family 2 protein n=1 Tax=Halococcus dombrowskii TaxID=179637 RepID=A0AAV3SF50_HALDO|nr:glycosyltransferase family 2 protein [Halococcus dombrowskii]UOO95083.1 glycosyltransferase family 2 protein [Halococcus dombrowskii]
METDSRPLFSLVFLTWNAGEAILRTLESVEQQSFTDYEIVVVDNNSQDDTLQLLRNAHSEDDSVRIVENEQNRGFSRGINRGIRESDGQYICCYNHDTLFPDGYLRTLSERVTPDAVWTTARRNYRVSSERTCVRLLSQYRFTLPYRVDSLSGVAEVNYVPGDGVIVPRGIYRDVLSRQVFDPAMPLRVEDVDLSLRLADAGVPMRAILDTQSIHPDNDDMYAPSVRNFVTLAKMIRARVVVHRKNTDSLLPIVIAASSIVLNPLVIYCTAYPRSADAFVDATSVS